MEENIATIGGVFVTVVVNIGVVAYAWGSLRAIVNALREVVENLREITDKHNDYLASLDRRVSVQERVCRMNHPPKGDE